MRTADIVVGQRYKTKWHGVVDVLETRVERFHGRRDGVRISYQNGLGHGREKVVGAMEIRFRWTDEREEAERRALEEDKRRRARMEELRARAALAELKVNVTVYRQEVSMGIDVFETLLGAYEGQDRP